MINVTITNKTKSNISTSLGSILPYSTISADIDVVTLEKITPELQSIISHNYATVVINNDAINAPFPEPVISTDLSDVGDSIWSDAAGVVSVQDRDALLVGDAGDRFDPKLLWRSKNTSLPNSPQFGFGAPYIAGIGLEAFGIWYKDDTSPDWLIRFSAEKSGTFASILDGVRRSSVETFINDGGEKPWFRIEASTQGINFGPGDAKVLVGNAVRSGGVLTVETETEHKFGVGQKLWKQGGQVSDFGADGEFWGPGATTMTVATTPDSTHFTVSDARPNVTSTVELNFSSETDVSFARDGRNIGAVRVNNSTVTQFDAAGIKVPSGLSILSTGSALQLGAGGNSPAEVSANTLHVKEGFTFYNEGIYRSTGWFNGGSQTQTTQEVFVVDTGSGVKSTTIREILGVDWMVFRIKNRGANNLTVNPTGSDTIDGDTSLVLPGWSAATLVSNGTNWEVFYNPPPP